MLTYIVRRLLLMIPTLLGISFLVFMLIALSPGGIGAGLKFSAGGQMEATNAAQLEAYLDDRYGLKDPAVMQYLRWLSRVSPIKFGTRDQLSGDQRIRAPKVLADPLAWRWFIPALPAAPVVESPIKDSMTPEQKNRAYRSAANTYAQKRAAYVANAALYKQSLAAYGTAALVPDAASRRGELNEGWLSGHTPNKAIPEWAEVERRWNSLIQAYQSAQESRAVLDAAFRSKPYPEAGIPIIPGILSLATPDLGESFSLKRDVSDLLKEALPVTLLLNCLAFPIIYLIAIPGGMLAATRQGSWIDNTLGVVFVGLWSIPTVWAGVMAVGFLASKDYLGWFPVSSLHASDAASMTFLPSTAPDGTWVPGFALDTLWHVCLPVLCLVYGGFAVLAKQTRAAMLDNFNADYVRTAKAKGVAGKDIVLRHVFRNSLLPLITMFATIFPAMLAGSVVIERIFTVRGMGHLLIEAITLRDRELILADAVLVAGVNLLALLLADILYALADPRITYD